MSLRARFLAAGAALAVMAALGCSNPVGSALVPVGESSPTNMVMGPTPLPTATPYNSPLIGQAAPGIRFLGLDGKTSSLEAFKGKKVLLTFFATWCPHCQADLPKFQAYALPRPELAFVPVEASRGPKAEVENFARTYGMTVPLYYDESGTVAQIYSVDRFPLSFLLDADGRVRDAFTGSRTDAQLTELLAKF